MKILILLIFLSQTPALDISGSLSVDEYQLVELTATGPKIDSCVFDILYAPDITYLVSQSNGNEKGTKIIFTGPCGDYRVSCTAYADGKMQQKIALVTIKKGSKPPDPKPIDPPKPVEPPKEYALRVLMIYESEDLSKYPPEQVNALRSQSLRKYLNSVCLVVDRVPEWRIFDKDTNMENESKAWQDLMNKPFTTLPWIIINNGVEEFEGPLPLTAQEIAALVKKYVPVKRRASWVK